MLRNESHSTSYWWLPLGVNVSDCPSPGIHACIYVPNEDMQLCMHISNWYTYYMYTRWRYIYVCVPDEDKHTYVYQMKIYNVIHRYVNESHLWALIATNCSVYSLKGCHTFQPTTIWVMTCSAYKIKSEAILRGVLVRIGPWIRHWSAKGRRRLWGSKSHRLLYMLRNSACPDNVQRFLRDRSTNVNGFDLSFHCVSFWMR